MFRRLKTSLDKCRAILEAAKSKGVAYNSRLEDSFRIYKEFVQLAEKKNNQTYTDAVFQTYISFVEDNADDIVRSDTWYTGAVFYPGGQETEVDKCFRLGEFHELSQVVDPSKRLTTILEIAMVRLFIEVANETDNLDEDFAKSAEDYMKSLEENLESSRPVSGVKAVKDMSRKLNSDGGLDQIGDLFKKPELISSLLSGVTTMIQRPEIRQQLNGIAQTAGIQAPPPTLQAPQSSAPAPTSAPVSAPTSAPVPVSDDM